MQEDTTTDIRFAEIRAAREEDDMYTQRLCEAIIDGGLQLNPMRIPAMYEKVIIFFVELACVHFSWCNKSGLLWY